MRGKKQLPRWIPEVGQHVQNKNTRMKGIIAEVDNKFGSYAVLYTDGVKKYYKSLMPHEIFRQLPDTERADQRLRQEALGLTNSWRED